MRVLVRDRLSQMVSHLTGVGLPESDYICCKFHGDDDGILHYQLPTKIGASAAVCVNIRGYSLLCRVLVRDRPSQMVSPQTGVRLPELIYMCCKLHGHDDGMLHYHLPTKIGASAVVSVNLFKGSEV